MNDDDLKFLNECEQCTSRAWEGPWSVRPSGDCHDELTECVIAKGHGNLTVCSEIEDEVEYDNSSFIALAREAVPRLCAMVREQDKRARHAEAERDAFDTRIGELEEQLRRCKEHKERNDAISFRVQNTRERQIAELNKMVDDHDAELAILRSRAGVCER